MWCSKAPILFLYMTLFGIKRHMRISCYIVLVILGIAVIAAAAVTSASCNPGNDAISQEFILKCSSVGSTSGVALGVVSVIVDIIIFILPLASIWRLQLPKIKKVGLAIMFTTGIL
jgi:hypothetical protein